MSYISIARKEWRNQVDQSFRAIVSQCLDSRSHITSENEYEKAVNLIRSSAWERWNRLVSGYVYNDPFGFKVMCYESCPCPDCWLKQPRQPCCSAQLNVLELRSIPSWILLASRLLVSFLQWCQMSWERAAEFVLAWIRHSRWFFCPANSWISKLVVDRNGEAHATVQHHWQATTGRYSFTRWWRSCCYVFGWLLGSLVGTS